MRRESYIYLHVFSETENEQQDQRKKRNEMVVGRGQKTQNPKNLYILLEEPESCLLSYICNDLRRGRGGE